MNARESKSAFSLRNRLDEFRQFQEFCGAYQHGIRQQRPPKRLYATDAATPHSPRRATTFVYAFFVFNNMYQIDSQ